MRRNLLLALAALLAMTATGCAQLKKWLNTEPQFSQKQELSKSDKERHSGIAGDLNDVEYAEYERIRKQNELDRNSRSLW